MNAFPISKLALACVVMTLSAAVFADPIQVAPQPTNPDVFMNQKTTGVIRPTVNYTAGGNNWQNTTNPLNFVSASTLNAQGLENPLLQALSNNLGAGWSYNFNTAANIADNSFQVHTYTALAPTPPASNGDGFVGNKPNCVTNNNCVGSQFYFTYNPTGDDPTSNLHWVQLLYDNWDNNNNTVPAFYEIDNNGGTVPYYDEPFTANSSGFYDLPFRSAHLTDPTTFDALTLLVSGPDATKPGTFTIYGGIEWGWHTSMVPEVDGLYLMTLGLLGIGVRARRHLGA